MGIGVKTKPKKLDISTLELLNEAVTDATLVDETHTHSSSDITGLIAFPPPYLKDLIPDSHAPNSTGNFILKGSFFTESMSVLIEGQTVNNTVFINSHEVHVNVTSGANEGTFNVTLNNGTEAIFTDALLIILGTVYTPKLADWHTIVGSADLSIDGEATMTVSGQVATAKCFTIPPTIDISVRFRLRFSPFYPSSAGTQSATGFSFSLVNKVTGLRTYSYTRQTYGGINGTIWGHYPFFYNTYIGATSMPHTVEAMETLVEIKRVNNVVQIFYNNGLGKTFAQTVNDDQEIMISTRYYDVFDIKYIELA